MLHRIGTGLGLGSLDQQLAETKILSARILINQMKAQAPFRSISEAEFKVFSQFGDDGIIQFLIRETAIAPNERSFVEFGVQDYLESNTRFLLMNDNWGGLIMDGSREHMEMVRNSAWYWRYDLTALCAFVTCDNINALLREHRDSNGLGLLSIDIDGNDYWVWEKIDAVAPVIVVVEYNSVFGPEKAVTVPYEPVFMRATAHYSHLYWGCSLAALCRLAERKGYAFVGSNSAGNNAYFVRKDRLGGLCALTSAEGFVNSRFRESRDASGRLSYLSGDDRLREIHDMPVYDVESGQTVLIKDQFI